jgi:hypothetical protein
MSGLPQTADISRPSRHFAFVPFAYIRLVVRRSDFHFTRPSARERYCNKATFWRRWRISSSIVELLAEECSEKLGDRVEIACMMPTQSFDQGGSARGRDARAGHGTGEGSRTRSCCGCRRLQTSRLGELKARLVAVAVADVLRFGKFRRARQYPGPDVAS